MKGWNRILAALLATIMLMVPFTATAEPALEADALPEAEEGLELEIAPEAAEDAPDVELELDDALALDGFDIEDIDLETATAEDAAVDAAEAEADNSAQVNDVDSDFEIDEDGVLIKYKGDGGDVVIPDGVTKIGEEAFCECDSLTSVTIPGSVTEICDGNDDDYVGAFLGCNNLANVKMVHGLTYIGYNAFYNCDSLTSVTIPGSVTSIGNDAFPDCDSLTDVTIPEGVTNIGNYAFFHCDSLTDVTIPEGVTNIGNDAFFSCDSLTRVTIPASVTSIGESAFGACDSLEAINVSSKNPSYTSRDGILYTRDMKTLLQCPGAKTTVVVPNGVTSIGDWAFEFCYSLTRVTIPASVTSIGELAFFDCYSLTGVTILAKSIDIDKNAFYDSDPTFHIVEGSNAIRWARAHDYDYDTFTEGLSKKSLTLSAGQTHKLTVRVQGKLTTDVTWSSNNKKIATVKNGKVTALKAGTCTITAKVTNGKTLKCKVKVKDAAKLNKTKLTMKPGNSQTLKISGLNGRKVTWSSSNNKIATVKDGKVTAVYIGSCTITAQIKDGKKLSCKVTVTDEARLSSDKLTISNIDSDVIKLTGGLNRKVTWSTSNKNVVEITGSDNNAASIKAVKNGAATITAKVAGGKTLKCVVKVVNPLTITVDEIYEESIYNELWVYFNNHSNKKITYVTLNIAQYNNRGDALKSPYDYYYLNETVAPHDSLHHYYWVNDDTKKVRIRITEVTFADKTTWRP